MSTDRPRDRAAAGARGGRRAAPGAARARERRNRAGDPLFIVGLVGRAGSGKSTVARALVEDGARLIEADRIGHEITDHDPEVRAALIEEYGSNVYRPDGALDRARVGARVFADKGALERLNRLVHPHIVATMRRRLDALRGEGFRGTVLVDAALMLDWHFERECDAVIAVVAPDREQVLRLMSSRGWSESDARARLAAQRTNDDFTAAADAVIENSGPVAELPAAARAALARLRATRDLP